MADKSHCIDHHAGLQRLLEDGLFADLIIVCGEERISVHKAILSAQSSFFRSACTLDMQEKREGVIRLDDDVNTVRCFVDFCYGGLFDNDKRSEGVSEVLHHAMVYTIAVFFDNRDLQALTTECFANAGAAKEIIWSTADKTALEIIRFVFRNTSSKSDPLRVALLTMLQERTFDIGDEAALYGLIADVPEFGAAYMTFCAYKAKLLKKDGTSLTRMRDEIRGRSLFRCGGCAFVFRLPSAWGAGIKCPGCHSIRLAMEPGVDELSEFFGV